MDLRSEGKVNRLAVADASQPVAVRDEEDFVRSVAALCL